MEELLGAIARGYCTKENEGKVLDAELCKAIANEVYPLFTEARKKFLEEEIDYWHQVRKVEVLSDEHHSIADSQISRLEAELKALDK